MKITLKLDFFYSSLYLTNTAVYKDLLINKNNIDSSFNNFGEDKLEPLSTYHGEKFFEKYFSTKFTTNIYPMSLFATTKFDNNEKTRSKLHARHIFLNKFIQHGKKERIRVAYAKALNYIKTIESDNITSTDLLLCTDSFKKNNKNFSKKKKLEDFNNMKTLLFFSKPKNNNDNLFSINSIFTILSYKNSNFLNFNYSAESTELAFYQALVFSPLTVYVIRKIKKKIYKATRGKFGRYSKTPENLSHKKIYTFMFKWYKQQYREGSRAGLVSKLTDTVAISLFDPTQGYGYKLAKDDE